MQVKKGNVKINSVSREGIIYDQFEIIIDSIGKNRMNKYFIPIKVEKVI